MNFSVDEDSLAVVQHLPHKFCDNDDDEDDNT